MKNKTIRITESELKSIIENAVSKVIDESGDTDKGQEAYGMASERRSKMADDAKKRGDIESYIKNSKLSDKLYNHALKSAEKRGLKVGEYEANNFASKAFNTGVKKQQSAMKESRTKKLVRLTESDVHNIIKSALNRIVKESREDHGDYHDGMAWVIKDGKYNYVNKKNELMSDKWFDAAYDFNDGFGIVEINGKYNFMNTFGEIVSEKWFDDCKRFHDGFAAVSIRGMWNFINGNGELVSKKWYDWVGDFDDGCGEVIEDGETKFINPQGEYVIPKRYDFG